VLFRGLAATALFSLLILSYTCYRIGGRRTICGKIEVKINEYKNWIEAVVVPSFTRLGSPTYIHRPLSSVAPRALHTSFPSRPMSLCEPFLSEISPLAKISRRSDGPDGSGR
jgi:hypothetical protein